MTKTIRFAAAGVAMAAAMGMTSVAHAQETETATASAEILQPLTLTPARGLDFGRIIVESAALGGTATVGTADASTASCSANLVCLGGSASANFDVTGTANRDVSVDLTSSSITITTGGGAPLETMTVNLVTSAGATGDEITLDNTGAGEFFVGGDLLIVPNQVAGIYTGNMEVTVSYP